MFFVLMKKTSSKNVFFSFATALLVLGGAVCFQALAQENEAAAGHKLNSVSISVEGDMRYISAYGVPLHAAANLKALGIEMQPYAFRVHAKPKTANASTIWAPGMFFGVALDGVPIAQSFSGAWNSQENWVMRGSKADQHGGMRQSGGRYVYTAAPAALVNKNLSHVGYAADGFPIFVSQSDTFTSSYSLKEGRRPEPPAGPGGIYDGTYLSDYVYIPRSGVLDRCNGIKVKNKYYIYIIGHEFPQIPLCWSGVPDQSFANNDALHKTPSSNNSYKSRKAQSKRKRRVGG